MAGDPLKRADARLDPRVREPRFDTGITFSLRGEQHTVNLTADAQPFGLERIINRERSYIFFPG